MSVNALSLHDLPSLHRQRLFSEFAALKQACPEGIFVSLTPGDPALWTAVLFVRHGPYAQAVLRFQLSFPDAYPRLPPLVTFSTDMFHPLISPLTTYMYTTDIQDNGTVSARDEERLLPGGFSLRHGFPEWYGRGRRPAPAARQASGEQPRGSTPAQASRPCSTTSTPGAGSRELPTYMQTAKHDVSVYHILTYIRSTFDQDHVLDSVPLEAAGNPGAWQAWRTHRRKSGKSFEPSSSAQDAIRAEPAAAAAESSAQASHAASQQSGQWNWDGVWEDRVKKGIAASLSDSVLYGASGPDDLIRFLAMEESEVTSVKENLLRTLDNPA
ncbi:hypothetical protein HIM_00615 [Hirsutella minnesotensis 3608]|nr:hypothetical protein HIM_00615 [Hirsutella minnesotensis 3608]